MIGTAIRTVGAGNCADSPGRIDVSAITGSAHMATNVAIDPLAGSGRCANAKAGRVGRGPGCPGWARAHRKAVTSAAPAAAPAAAFLTLAGAAA